jgi:hypothetical protein
MLYSYQNQYPKPIPFRIKLSDGRTRTDPSTFTEEEIADAGFVAVADKPTITDTQVLSWNGELLEWNVRDKTEEELWQEYIATVPETVTMRQARLALQQQGLLVTVDATIATIEGSEGDAARIEWEYASEVNRNSPLVQSLVVGLAWTEQQLLDLFLLANTL